MLRRDPKPGPAIRALCEPLAAQQGVDYNLVTLQGPETHEEWAFGFARFGASLVLNLAEKDGYPGDGRKARTRGARAVARTFGTDAASAATVFMGHALFEHMATVQEADGHADSADAYRNVRSILTTFYPLALDDEEALEECSAQLRHLQEGTAPSMASMDLNGFHLAARAGRDPREDVHLVDIQRRTVGDYFRRGAAAHAVEMCVGPTAFAELDESFLWLSNPSFENLAFKLGELATWSSVSEPFCDAVSEYLDSFADPT